MSHKKPEKLKKLQGTSQPCRVVDQSIESVMPDVLVLPVPDTLNHDGQAIWVQITSRLASLGLLYDVSVPILESYCMSYQMMVDAHDFIRRNGYKDEDGRIYPEWKVFQDCQKEVRAIADRFGFTPSSAARIPMAPPEKPKENPFDKLKNR